MIKQSEKMKTVIITGYMYMCTHIYAVIIRAYMYICECVYQIHIHRYVADV